MRHLKIQFLINRILICLCFFVLSASYVYAADTDDKEIMVIGSGSITRENLAEARKHAISDAYVKGIESYLEKKLGRKGMINNFENIINEIIPGSADVIEKFDTLAAVDSGKSYKILVSIKINEKLMEEKLRNSGVILYEGIPLRILFLVSDRTSPDSPPFIWWDDPENKTNLSSSELILHRLLQERGFNPVNRLTSMPENGYDPELFKDDLTDEEAAQWGKLYSADVVLTGRVDIDEFNTIITDIKAIEAENGSVLGSYSHEEIPLIDTEAGSTNIDILEQILGEGVAKITPEILKAFKKEDEKLSRFDIVLKDLDSLRQAADFIYFLKEKISGVVSVLPARITREAMTISVEYSGGRNIFIEKVKNSIDIPFAVEIGIDETGSLNITSM